MNRGLSVLYFLLAFVILFVLTMTLTRNSRIQLESRKIYRMEIINDHDAMFVSGKDTIIVEFENAFVLKGQSKYVYINH